MLLLILFAILRVRLLVGDSQNTSFIVWRW